jgi:WD40 repeat protein
MMQLMAGGRTDGGGFCVAVAPDGKTLAAAGGNVAQLWEVATGNPLRQIQAPAGSLSGLVFSPDGRMLAGRTSNSTLYLWSVDSGAPLRQLKPPQRPAGNLAVFTLGGGVVDVPGMAFTPDGKALVAVMTEYEQQAAVQTIKSWDVATGRVTRRVKAPDGVTPSAVAVSPNGKILAYAGRNVVHLCDAETGQELRNLPAPDGGVLTLAFSPDGKTLSARSRNQRVRLWESATGKELRQLAEAVTAQPSFGRGFALVGGPPSFPPESRVVAFSQDGTRLTAASGNSVRVWETATGKELPLPGGHRRAPTALALSADGKTTVSWGPDRVVRRWETATGKDLGAFPAPPGTTLAALSADGQLIALANADGTVRLLETATGKQRHRFSSTQGSVSGLAFSPDGRVLAARGGNNVIRLYDVARGTEMRAIGVRPGEAAAANQVIVFGGPARPSGPGLAFSPDGRLLVAPGMPDNALVLIDVATGKELRRIVSTRPVTSLAFSPDGRSVATEHADRTVTFWEVASGKQRARLGTPVAEQPGADGRMGRVAFVVDGDFGNVAEPSGPIGVTFSPDGRALAVRGAGPSVHVWDIAAGKEIGQLKGHAGRVETIAFAPDGKMIASGAADTTILVWDASDPLRRLSKPSAVELTAAQVETLWGDLAAENAGKALRGVRGLGGDPARAVPFLSDRLKPAPRINPDRIKGWLTDLDSAKFAVRQDATAQLLKAGEQALPALRRLLAGSPSLETRQRAEVLVDRLTSGALTPEQLRTIRAVEALERMGTPESRQLLQSLAKGGPGALPTWEAQAALDRLAGKTR